MRIGFAVKVLGEGGIKECDMRRHKNNPHLKCSIEMIHEVFEYLNRADIRMYRMSSDLAPYLTHPDMPQFHNQLEESREELAALGKKAREYDLRLSLHPSQYIVLNAVDEAIATKSIADLNAQAMILEMMGLDERAVVITHVGGAYGDKKSGIERFARRYEQLPEITRRRLVVENDDVTYSARDALRVHELCGIRVVFDNLHHFCNNPLYNDAAGETNQESEEIKAGETAEDSGAGAAGATADEAGQAQTQTGEGQRLSMREALTRALATWPEGQTPKIHYSSPRTESQEQARKNGKTGKMENYETAPENRLHADYINPMEFLYFLEKAQGLRPFDIMVEAKSKDLAVLKLRKDLAKYGTII